VGRSVYADEGPGPAHPALHADHRPLPGRPCPATTAPPLASGVGGTFADSTAPSKREAWSEPPRSRWLFSGCPDQRMIFDDQDVPTTTGKISGSWRRDHTGQAWLGQTHRTIGKKREAYQRYWGFCCFYSQASRQPVALAETRPRTRAWAQRSREQGATGRVGLLCGAFATHRADQGRPPGIRLVISARTFSTQRTAPRAGGTPRTAPRAGKVRGGLLASTRGSAGWWTEGDGKRAAG